MNILAISFLLISVACVADSLSIDSTFNKDTCTEGGDQCKNGAQCKKDGAHFFCKCLKGTSGPFCNTIDECHAEHEKCGVNSSAKCVYNIPGQVADCICDEDNLEYDVSQKLCRETCDEQNICQNGGACNKIGHYSFCECIPGTKGANCGTVIKCEDKSLVCEPGSGSICGFNINSKRAECLCQGNLKYDASSETCRETCDERNVCLHGGICIKIGHYSFCECIPGTEGSQCGTVIKCEDGSLVCKPESGSICGFNIDSKRAECLCQGNLKYDASSETCRETCLERGDQCRNGAKCNRVGTYSFCNCLKGTSGSFCNTIDECHKEHEKCGANSGAKCVYNISGQVAECKCNEDKLKYEVTQKVCRGTCNEEGDQCKNGATCETDGTHSFCKCLKGTSGSFCDMIDKCIPEKEKCGKNSGATCVYDIDLEEAKCECYHISLVYDPFLNLCIDSSSTPLEFSTRSKYSSFTPGEFSTRSKYSSFTPGEFSTRSKYSSFTPGEFSTRSKYSSSTPGEFSTRSKSVVCDEEENDCVNGAECIDFGNERICHCLKGTYGNKCQHMWDCDERYNLKCNYRNGEICSYNTTSEESECLCVENELHYDTEHRKCRKTCEVGKHDCENGAICKAVGSHGFCECRPGTNGHKCEKVLDCDYMNCINTTGGRCEYDRHLEIAQCVCDNGLKYDEFAYECRETCEVGNHDCENGAICKTIGSHGFCECRPGTNGHKCEKVIDCDNINCTNTTGGRCEYDRHLEIAKCVCDNGLKYDEYAYECRETCNPQENDCENGAMCEKEGNYSFCRCYPGSQGNKCEIVKDCESQKVMCNKNSGARCGINMDSRRPGCICNNSLKYDEELQECRETCNFYKNKCENGAHCNRIGDYLFCDCPPGFFGHRCEKAKDKGEHSPLLLILLCITSGFLLMSTITLVTVFIKFRSRRNK